MKEIQLRKWHRRAGIWMALFILVQTGSGLLITLGEADTSHSHAIQTGGGHAQMVSRSQKKGKGEEENLFLDILESVRHGGGLIGGIYRVVVGISLLFMAVTGTYIYLRSRTRSPRS